MTHLIPDDLTIPEFLKREPVSGKPRSYGSRGKRAAKIEYPRDGYECKGARQEERDRHRERLRRRAEKMRRRVK